MASNHHYLKSHPISRISNSSIFSKSSNIQKLSPKMDDEFLSSSSSYISSCSPSSSSPSSKLSKSHSSSRFPNSSLSHSTSIYSTSTSLPNSSSKSSSSLNFSNSQHSSSVSLMKISSFTRVYKSFNYNNILSQYLPLPVMCKTISLPFKFSFLHQSFIFFIIFLASMPIVHGDESLETLDRFICLRPTGFFPHDVQCDHFYECRNSTIINEGICKTGLRFDYRYRKKPRCIAADLIDCRITQVDLDSVPEFVSEEDFSGQSAPATTTSTTTTSTTTTTTSTTTEMPTTSGLWMGNRPRHHHYQHSNHNHLQHQHRNQHHHHHHSSNRNRYNPRPFQTTTTTTTTTPPPPPPEDDSDEINNSAEVDSEPNENALGHRQQLTRKPLQLRRGSLQESSAAAHYSISSSGGLSSHHTGRSISSAEDDIISNNRLTSQLESATPRPSRSAHCPAPNGYFADREDCRKFYACDDGRAFPMSCPLGLAYDEQTGTCNWPDMVDGCRGEEMLRFTCPDPYENDVLDYGDPRYPTSDCRKFVVCVVSELYGARTPRLLGCEEGLVFNPDSRACDLPENVPQCSNYYTDRGYPANYFRRAQLREQKESRKRRLRH